MTRPPLHNVRWTVARLRLLSALLPRALRPACVALSQRRAVGL